MSRQIPWRMIRQIALTILVAALGSPSAADTQVPGSRAEISLSFAPVVRAAAPAVVNIYTRKTVERRLDPFSGDPAFERFFGEFFGRGLPQRRTQTSLGSGVILDAEGIVVSNHHVVAGADEITVVLADRREFAGEVILADREADLAVIQLRGASGLPVLEMRPADSLEVGDLVLAIGNPFGVGQTVTSGIVSGLARAGAARGEGGYFIQTDAAINPGNSGGALVDMSGRLVGVPTSILSRSGGSIGIGFAVPADLVGRVVAEARAGSDRLVRPWLGLDGQTVGGELAEALGLDRPRGVLIEEIHPMSPLAEAGLERGDVILAIDGAAIDSPAALEFRAAALGVGREARLGYLRGADERAVAISLSPAPDEPARRRSLIERGALAGLSVETINPAVIAERDLPISARGVLVTGVRGPARRSGLRPGDILLSADGEAVTLERLDAVGRGLRVVLEVERKGKRGRIRIGG